MTTIRGTRALTAVLVAAAFLLATAARAQEEEPKKAPSPWLLLPTFSNNPKLGSAVGFLAGYIRKLDAQSQVSIFGVSAQYTSTDSTTAVLFGRTSFAADQHRLNVFAIGGLIRNDYDDFLGTGTPLKSEDHIRSFGLRYLYRLKDDWFVGAQVLSTNYEIVGQTAQDDDVIALLGLKGFKSSGAGIVGQHDSRDRTDSPPYRMSMALHVAKLSTMRS